MAENDLFRYLPLIAIAVVAANLAVFWHRARRLSAKTPAKTSGYHAIVRGFGLYFGGLTILWSVGTAAHVFHIIGIPTASSVLVPREPTTFDWLFLVAWALVALRFSVWLYARDGANVLVNHGDIFNSFPSSPAAVKVVWALLLLVSLASAIYHFTN